MENCTSFENDKSMKSSSDFIDLTNKISEFYTWYLKYILNL